MTTRSSVRKTQPLDRVEWVDPAQLRANNYNPNHVFGPELELLRLSILGEGWTQPIVILPDGEIIDGFHRWKLGSTDPEIRTMSGNRVPVVVVPAKSKTDQMIATVRHNRARGQHGILAMGEIVRTIEADLGPDETERRLGMEPEERERLADTRSAPELVGKDSFGRGWVPTRDAAPPSPRET